MAFQIMVGMFSKLHRHLPYRSKQNICLSSMSILGHSFSGPLHEGNHLYRKVQMDRGNQIPLPSLHRPNHSNKCESLRHIHQYLQKRETLLDKPEKCPFPGKVKKVLEIGIVELKFISFEGILFLKPSY